MRLRRLELSAYRCFPGRVEIDGLGDGLTIVVGDNEEGKSTLLAALQSALFDRHNMTGDAAEAMQPYGSAVRPEIILEFDLDSIRYQLRKAFCQRPEAELRTIGGNDRRWTGAQAEERLREMLLFTPAGRGAARSGNRGLQALFWVEQGNAYLAPPVNESIRETFAGALEREVGTVVGGERGRILLARVKARLDRFFTPTGRPKTGGPLAVMQTKVEDARKRRDELSGQLEKFEARVDDLARRRQTLADLERDDPLGEADARTAAATAAVKIVEGLESDLQMAVSRCQAAEAEEKLAETQVAARQKLRSEVEKARQERATAADDEVRKRAALAATDTSLDQLKGAHANTKRDVREATAEEARARALAELLEARARLAEADDRLKKAENTALVLRELRAKVETNPIDPKTMRSLRELEKAAREAELRRQTSATLIEFQPHGEHQAAIAGVAIESSALVVAEPTRISLEGFGAIRVVPGGEELAAIRAKAERARDALTQALAGHGVTTAQEAERRADERERQVTEAKAHETILATQAPRGLEELRSSVEMLGARVRELEKTIEDCAGEEAGAAIDAVRDQAAAAARRLEQCQKAERKASDALLAEEGRRNVAAAALGEASARCADANERVASLAATIETAEAEVADDALLQCQKKASAASEAAAAAQEDARRALYDSDPPGVRAELEQARKARDAVAQQLDRARTGVNDLTIELRTLGQQDLAAQQEIAQGETERAETGLARETHEAQALQLLLRMLVQAEHEAREVFMAPITRRVAPYLRRLFPGSEIVLDDNTLEITHLRRGGYDEPFKRLSVGTREQLAVLTRIAFAELLREHGKDSPIVLDDALVYSDDDRFTKMQQILLRASASGQIIVLTCHERAYFSLGAPIVRLAECRV